MKTMNQLMTRILARACLPLLGCCLTTAGCDSKAAPPAPSPERVVQGMTRDRTHYRLLKWDEGLAVMLVDRMDVASESGSSGAGEPDRRRGSTSSWDRDSREWRQGYVWQLVTSDGRAGVFSIDDVEYDLEDGAVFRVDVDGDTTTVRQLDRDLSGLGADQHACDRFVTSDPELVMADEPSDKQ